MRLIADENFPADVVTALRAAGHDVFWVLESMRSAGDAAILARGGVEGRTVITFDKDFGELAFRYGLPADCGVLLFRLAGVSPETDNRRALAVITSRSQWSGCFVTVTDAQVRVRPLPAR